MKKNLKGCVDMIEAGEPTVLVDMNQYDLIEQSGMTPDLVHKKSAHMSGAWHFADTERVRIPIAVGVLADYRYLTFSVFSVRGAGGSFSLMFDNGAEGDGKNGYECSFSIKRDGWNDYRVELPFMRAVGEPSGWDRITYVCFDCVVGGQANRTDTVLYIDDLFGWEEMAPPAYVTMPELKGAAVFSKSGSFSIIDRKRISNTADGVVARPFESNGRLWLPMAPVAAGIARSAVVDNRAFTLSFTYRRKKYVFSGDSDRMTVNGVEEQLGFYPAVLGGTLFFPMEFVKNFFHWRQCYVDPVGLIVLSNRRNVFDSVKDEETVWQLIADTTFTRPDADRILNDLHRHFPNPARGRLFASFDELMELRRTAKNDAALKGYVSLLKAEYGTKSAAYAEMPVSAETVDADVLSSVAKRLTAFSMLYRVTGDKQYAERAALDAEALAALNDWSLGSLSNVGRVALAVAICYDWCHHVWSEGRKATVERGMLRNAMRPGVEVYHGKGKMWRAGSVQAAEVNAGMLAMALALADVYPQTAYKLLSCILRNLEPCFAAYAPDGGYAEGVAAWEKSSRALALTVAMLKKACGTDYGLASAPGFTATAYFPIYTETVNGAWNYHDCAASSVDTSMAFLFSRMNEDPVPAWMRRQQLLLAQKKVDPFDILFYVPVDDAATPQLPLDAVYRKAGLAAMRSGWGREATFVGLHGGSNLVAGGDLDAGSVILEMGGERFLVETGGESALPMLTRRRAAGQNTLTVDLVAEPAPDQNPDAVARLTEMRSVDERAYAVVDMTTTNDAILRGKRGVLLCESRRVAVIQDELTLSNAAEVVFTAWTRAEVALSRGGRVATLTQNQKTMAMRLCGVSARFTVEKAEGTDLSLLKVCVGVKEKLRMAVVCRLLAEGENGSEKAYELIPMSKWSEI